MPVSSPRLLPGAPDTTPDPSSDVLPGAFLGSGDATLPSAASARRRRRRGTQQQKKRLPKRESDDRAMSSRGPRDARPSRGDAAPGKSDGESTAATAGEEQVEKQVTDEPAQRTLREWRIARGMTQQQVAFASGLGITTVREIEREKRLPSFVTARKLVRVLGVTFEQVRWPEEHYGPRTELGED